MKGNGRREKVIRNDCLFFIIPVKVNEVVSTGVTGKSSSKEGLATGTLKE